MNKEIEIDGVYHHFKDFIVKVIAIAKHTETGESLVMYEFNGNAVNSDHINGIYPRLLEMFPSEVDHTKYPDVGQKYRCELIVELIEEHEDNAWNIVPRKTDW